LNGTAKRVPQNDEEASYASNLSREDERIDGRLHPVIFSTGLEVWCHSRAHLRCGTTKFSRYGQ